MTGFFHQFYFMPKGDLDDGFQILVLFINIYISFSLQRRLSMSIISRHQ